jgi:anti-sigma factor RsiW
MPRNSSDHALHDLSLIAAHAAGDLPETDRSQVDLVLASCTTCTELRRDLVAIAAATRALPAPLTLSRDFRLDEAQASRLRRGSWLRSALRPFGAPRTVVRPLAAAFTSLGVAGLLVATLLPGTFLAGAPGAATSDSAMERLQASEPPAAQPGPVYPQAGQPTLGRANAAASPAPERPEDKLSPVASAGTEVAYGDDATQGAVGQAQGLDRDAINAPSVSPLTAGSVGLLALGLILFGLRFAGRRLR